MIEPKSRLSVRQSPSTWVNRRGDQGEGERLPDAYSRVAALGEDASHQGTREQGPPQSRDGLGLHQGTKKSHTPQADLNHL